jgi:hypothetical protein
MGLGRRGGFGTCAGAASTIGRLFGPPAGVAIAFAVALAQGADDRQLAELLANSSTREAAVARVAGSPATSVPLLLSWTTAPPPGVDDYELRVGLADALGEVRSQAAIPFLVKNLVLRRDRFIDLAPWLKTPEVVVDTFPAISALIKIGPEASRALILAARQPMTAEERLAAVFVVSRIKGVPEARPFLTSALAQADLERRWIEEGVRALDDRR